MTVSSAFSPLAIDPNQLRHISIRASAGSGKTYQLTSRYMQLIAAGEEPSSILASTFTRLAAGQIRDRILSDLAAAACKKDKRSELAKRLGVESISEAQITALLRKVARHLHLLQVRTLDSFFASIVHAFAIELGIPLDAEVADEHRAAQIRNEAIRLMLDERDPQKLVDLLRLLTQGASDRAVSEAIDHTVSRLYSLYQEAPELEIWSCVPELPGRLSAPELVDAIATLHAAQPTNSAQLKAYTKDCESARARRWGAFIKGGLAGPIIAGTCTYSRKPIEAHVIAAYQPLIAHAAAELVGRVRDQTLATRELLAIYQEHYEAVKQRTRTITFDDLAGAMAEAERLGKLDEIGFRIDAKLRHLLLDEFQDTSVPQWRALQPIAQELVSNSPPERTFFCVGDVKQSIYSWRGAAPEIFDELPNLLRGADGESAITQLELAKSYRSSQPVIDVVNLVFESLVRNDALADQPEVVQKWSDGFRTHETDRTSLPGHVELRVVATAQGRAEKDRVRFNAAADFVTDLNRTHPHLQIAMLTRTNRAVARLMYELGPSRRKIAGGVSGRGGGPLTDAPAVNAILDLLHLSDHPDDTCAAFHVANTPLGSALQFTQFDHAGHRRRLAGRVTQQLVDDGYSRTIANWARLIQSSCDAREFRRVMQLVDMATAHDATRTLRTGDFIEQVESADVPDIQPAAVQVMTIHQAKGLEFDIVVLPELDKQLIGTNPAVVFDRIDETGPIAQICRSMNKDVLALVPELQPMFDRHRRRGIREALSTLYVAMTRAIHGLYMFIDAPDLNKDGLCSERGLKSAAGILRCSLAPDGVKPNSVAFSHGTPPSKWPRTKDDFSALRPSVALPRGPIALAKAKFDSTESSAVKQVRVKPQAPSQKSQDAKQYRFTLPSDGARDRGVALHALFEQIEWIEDFSLDRAAHVEIAQSCAPRRSQQWAEQIVDSFGKLLDLPHVHQALSRSGADPQHVHLHRELPFARLESGKPQRGYIDRLTVHVDDAGRASAATIIDFKTKYAIDTSPPSSEDSPGERYRPQLQAYRAAVSELFGLDEACVRMLVLEVSESEALAISL